MSGALAKIRAARSDPWVLSGIAGWTIVLVLCLAPLIACATWLPVGRGAGSDSATGVRAAAVPRRAAGNPWPNRLRLFANGAKVALIAAAFSALLGIPAGFFVTKTDVPGKRFWQFLWLPAFVIPPHIHGISWLGLLGSGAKRGVLEAYVAGSNEFLTAGWALSMPFAPLAAIIAAESFRRADPSQEAAGRLMRGAFGGPAVSCRLALPGIATGVLLAFMLALSNFDVPGLMGLSVLQLEVFSRAAGEYDFAGAAESALPLMFAAAGGGIAVAFGFRKVLSEGSGKRKVHVYELGMFRWAAMAWCLALAITTIGIPAYALTRAAGGMKDFIPAVRMASPALVTSMLAGCAACAIALPAAVLITNGSRGAGIAGLSALCVSLVAPGLLAGLGLARIINAAGLQALADTRWILGVASAARFAPVAVLLLSVARRQCGDNAFNAARLSGLGFARSLLKIGLPVLLPGIAASAALCFALSLGEVDASTLISPPGASTLPMRIFSMYHYGQDQLVASFSILLAACSFAPMLLFMILRRKFSF
ncbi:MAG TPA: ABC transporter permease subunit [Candidatus Brocadiia bacterium]|nr:ABC transporter permease subunit [Candidatus Brocadiia bacterium]